MNPFNQETGEDEKHEEKNFSELDLLGIIDIFIRIARSLDHTNNPTYTSSTALVRAPSLAVVPYVNHVLSDDGDVIPNAIMSDTTARLILEEMPEINRRQAGRPLFNYSGFGLATPNLEFPSITNNNRARIFADQQRLNALICLLRNQIERLSVDLDDDLPPLEDIDDDLPPLEDISEIEMEAENPSEHNNSVIIPIALISLFLTFFPYLQSINPLFEENIGEEPFIVQMVKSFLSFLLMNNIANEFFGFFADQNEPNLRVEELPDDDMPELEESSTALVRAPSLALVPVDTRANIERRNIALIVYTMLQTLNASIFSYAADDYEFTHVLADDRDYISFTLEGAFNISSAHSRFVFALPTQQNTNSIIPLANMMRFMPGEQQPIIPLLRQFPPPESDESANLNLYTSPYKPAPAA